VSKKIPIDLITQAEAARIRDVTPEAIANLIKRGRLTAYDIAGRVHVRRSDVENFEKKAAGRPRATKKTTGKK
jgi:predicted XRE-type DNA-binding protein